MLEATGVDLPSSALVFATRTIVVSVGVGTLIALLASLRPAIRATRVEPIAAVREGAVLPASRFARYAAAASAIVGAVVVGAALLRRCSRTASRSRRGSPRSSAGVLLLFVGVAMIASRVVRPLAYVLGAPGARFGGAAGRLARQNAVRNPSRTASTAAAVMIGLALITFVAVIGAGLQDLVHERRRRAVRRRLRRRPAGNGDPLHEQGRAGRRRRHPGVEAVSEIRAATPRSAARRSRSTASTRNVTKVVAIDVVGGLRQRPAQLGHDGAFIDKRYAEDHYADGRLAADVKTPTGTSAAAARRRIVDPPKGGSPFGEVSVSTATFDGSFADHATTSPSSTSAAGRPTRTPRALERASSRSRPRWSRRATSSRRPASATSPDAARSSTRCSASR